MKTQKVKNMTKMLISLLGLLLFGTLYQILIGNKGSIIVGGLIIFSVGFGWYSSKAKEEESK